MDAIMDAEVSARTGTEHGERSPDPRDHELDSCGYNTSHLGSEP